MEPLFSDQEEIQPETLAKSLIPSPSGTSASLLSNPSLTDTLSNFPLFESSEQESLALPGQSQSAVAEQENENPDTLPPPAPPSNGNERGRPRGRPPGRRIYRTTSSNRGTTSSKKPPMRPKRGPRTRISTRAPPGTHDRAMTLPETLESQSPAHSDSRENTSPQVPRYQLRTNRAPRYKCGTCGSRNCTCAHQIIIEPPDLRLARGAPIPTCELTLGRMPDHPQHRILAVRAQRQEQESPPIVSHMIVTIEKTYTSIQFGVVPPLEATLRAMHDSSPSDCPTYRFKEWSSSERGGLEFTLAAIIPRLPPSITFGELDEKCTNIQMNRCITAHQLWEKYHVVSPRATYTNPRLVALGHFTRSLFSHFSNDTINMPRKPAYPS